MSNTQNKVFVEESIIPIPRCPYFIKRVWSIKEKETKGKESKKTNKVIIEKRGLINYEIVFINKKGDKDNRSSFNFSLAFYRYAPDISENLSESKRAWLNTLADKYNLSPETIPEGHIYHLISDGGNEDEIKNRIKNSVFSNGSEVEVITMQTAQPLIIGLGEASPYETGITLDFLTGLPIIPGSTLKGITRRAAIMIYGAEYWDKFTSDFEKKFSYQPEIKQFNGLKYLDLLPYGEEFAFVADQIENHFVPASFTEIFGTQDKKGKVIFMDAYPVNWDNDPDKKLFRLDVMNPHYGPYYSNEGWDKKEKRPVPPGDWYNPIPIFYLTVNVGVKYRFILAGKDNGLLKIAENWLKFALTEIGIGAKGNQGYGVFGEV